MTSHLVLVGGGHAHLTVLKNIGSFLGKGHRVTVISPNPYHYYSGMGPGMLSGLYEAREARFHIRKMVEDRGAAFINARVVRILPENRTLLLDNNESVRYDFASFNVGSGVPTNVSAREDGNVIPVKPVDNLYRARWIITDQNRHPEPEILVIGGGPAGVEIAANVWRLMQERSIHGRITLVTGERLMGNAPGKVRQLVLDSLAGRGVRIIEGTRVQSVETNIAVLTDRAKIRFDYAFMAVGVKPPPIFRDSGLSTDDDGGMLVNEYLQSVTHPEIFGGGDCISLSGHKIAKVGVYAVRQNPILYHNLMMALNGGEMKPFSPGGSYMLIMNMGDGKGILWKNNFIWSGRLSFLLKDYIDRRFMRKFQVSGELAEPSASAVKAE